MTRLSSFIGRSAPIVICLLVWEIVVVTGAVNPAFLPPVHEVAAALWHLGADGTIWADLAISTYRSLVGLFFGTLAGVALGLLMATSRRANGCFGPLVATTYSLPKTALVPLFILWFGIGNFTDMLTVFLASLLPVVVNTYHGVKAVPPTLVWSARAFGTSPSRILLRILMPASAPHILAGVRIALGFSWVLTISSEMIAAKSGIGKSIFLFGENGAYAYMFAGILAIVVVAYVLDRLMVLLTGRLLQWHDSARFRGRTA
jgi:ABC-type nitrate/sulfonate/bicarbonate transport system permease component